MRCSVNGPPEIGPIQKWNRGSGYRVGQLGREHRDDVQDGYGGEDPDPPHLTVHVMFHIRTSVRVDKQPAS
jgi:hypothetical protein